MRPVPRELAIIVRKMAKYSCAIHPTRAIQHKGSELSAEKQRRECHNSHFGAPPLTAGRCAPHQCMAFRAPAGRRDAGVLAQQHPGRDALLNGEFTGRCGRVWQRGAVTRLIATPATPGDGNLGRFKSGRRERDSNPPGLSACGFQVRPDGFVHHPLLALTSGASGPGAPQLSCVIPCCPLRLPSGLPSIGLSVTHLACQSSCRSASSHGRNVQTRMKPKGGSETLAA